MGLYTWKQPHRPGTDDFGWIVEVWTIWIVAAGIAVLVQSIPIRYSLGFIQSGIALSTLPLTVLFARPYAGNKKRPVRRSLFRFFPQRSFYAVNNHTSQQCTTAIQVRLDVATLHVPIILSNITVITYFMSLDGPSFAIYGMNNMPYGEIFLDTLNRLVDFNLVA